jgi:hypothetical protein
MCASPNSDFNLERRARQRFPVRLFLAVNCGPGDARNGVARDASEIGISFYCDTEIPIGSRIEFDVHVPPEGVESDRIFLRGKGRVIRNEPQASGRVLVAVVTDRYELREGFVGTD